MPANRHHARPLQVIADCPPARRLDLVFLQNGMLLPLLERHSLAGSTQALLYLAASPQGEITDGRLTVACGPHAEPLAALLRGGGVACRAVQRDEFLALMLCKLLWSCIYWLLSAGLGGVPVGALADAHGAAAAELAEELLPLGQAYLVDAAARLGLGNTTQVGGLCQCLCGPALRGGHGRGARAAPAHSKQVGLRLLAAKRPSGTTSSTSLLLRRSRPSACTAWWPPWRATAAASPPPCPAARWRWRSWGGATAGSWAVP